MPNSNRRLLTALAIVTLVAAPAAADAIAGCAIPLIPRPDDLTDRSWDARGLVMFLQEHGVVELKGERGQTILSVATLEHDERVRFPRDDRAVALTLEYVNPSGRGAPANSHKLVLLLLPAVQEAR